MTETSLTPNASKNRSAPPSGIPSTLQKGIPFSRTVDLFVACCAGWYVMELEILGGRILNIYFGSSIYVVWGSVIGVFLLSLSGGYLLGGWLSQRHRAEFYLSGNLAMAALWIFLLVYVREIVCESIFSLIGDERWGALIATLVLFAVPTVLLGTIAPLTVRRLTHKAERSGISAGLVFCLSTIASFVGCIITAFYLISYNLVHVFQISAAFLFLLSLMLFAYEIVIRRHISTPIESKLN